MRAKPAGTVGTGDAPYEFIPRTSSRGQEGPSELIRKQFCQYGWDAEVNNVNGKPGSKRPGRED